jgi:hypothetical protein
MDFLHIEKAFDAWAKLSTKKDLYEDFAHKASKLLNHLLSIETFKFCHLQIFV